MHVGAANPNAANLQQDIGRPLDFRCGQFDAFKFAEGGEGDGHEQRQHHRQSHHRIVEERGDTRSKAGDRVGLRFDPSRLYLFDKTSEARIR